MRPAFLAYFGAALTACAAPAESIDLRDADEEVVFLVPLRGELDLGATEGAGLSKGRIVFGPNPLVVEEPGALLVRLPLSTRELGVSLTLDDLTSARIVLADDQLSASDDARRFPIPADLPLKRVNGRGVQEDPSEKLRELLLATFEVEFVLSGCDRAPLTPFAQTETLVEGPSPLIELRRVVGTREAVVGMSLVHLITLRGPGPIDVEAPANPNLLHVSRFVPSGGLKTRHIVDVAVGSGANDDRVFAIGTNSDAEDDPPSTLRSYLLDVRVATDGFEDVLTASIAGDELTGIAASAEGEVRAIGFFGTVYSYDPIAGLQPIITLPQAAARPEDNEFDAITSAGDGRWVILAGASFWVGRGPNLSDWTEYAVPYRTLEAPRLLDAFLQRTPTGDRVWMAGDTGVLFSFDGGIVSLREHQPFAPAAFAPCNGPERVPGLTRDVDAIAGFEQDVWIFSERCSAALLYDARTSCAAVNASPNDVPNIEGPRRLSHGAARDGHFVVVGYSGIVFQAEGRASGGGE